MEMIADVFLIAGALAAAFYCYVLSRRIKGLTRLDTGLGGAITALSVQVDEMQVSVKAATKASGASMKDLVEITSRAEIAAGRLELLLSALHERGEGVTPIRPVKKDLPIPDNNDALESVEEPLLAAAENESNPSVRADLLNALQQAMAAVKR